MDTPKPEAVSEAPKNKPEMPKPNSMQFLKSKRFWARVLVYSVATVTVVGVIAVLAADQVTNNLREQSSPEVNTIENLTGQQLVVVDEVTEVPEIDTSDWVSYEDRFLGIGFMHPADANIQEFAGDTNNPFSAITINNYVFTLQVGDLSESYFTLSDNQVVDSDMEPVTVMEQDYDLKVLSFGSGAPAEFDEQGNPTCYTGGGSDSHFFEIQRMEDTVRVVISNSFSVTDCNPQREEVRSETDPKILATARKIAESLEFLEFSSTPSAIFDAGEFIVGIPNRMERQEGFGIFFGYNEDEHIATFADPSTVMLQTDAPYDGLSLFIDSINAPDLDSYADYIEDYGCPEALTQNGCPTAGFKPNVVEPMNVDGRRFLKVSWYSEFEAGYVDTYVFTVVPGRYGVIVPTNISEDELISILRSVEPK